jgi:membrane protein
VTKAILLPSDPVALARELAQKFGENRLMTYASAVAFRTFVALVPLALLGIALLGAFGQQKVWHRTLAPPLEKRFLPQVFDGINATVERIFQQGGWLLIAFAIALTIYYVSSAVRSIMSSLNEIDGTKEGRGTLARYAVSLGLTVAVVVCLGGAILLVTAGGRLAGSSGGVLHVGLGILRWLAAILLLALMIGIVVNYGSYQRHSKTWVSTGTAAIVLAWVVMSLVFKWFVSSVANYRTGPGILAAFLVLATYVYFSSIVFLVGIQLDELVGRER